MSSFLFLPTSCKWNILPTIIRKMIGGDMCSQMRNQIQMMRKRKSKEMKVKEEFYRFLIGKQEAELNDNLALCNSASEISESPFVYNKKCD